MLGCTSGLDWKKEQVEANAFLQSVALLHSMELMSENRLRTYVAVLMFNSKHISKRTDVRQE